MSDWNFKILYDGAYHICRVEVLLLSLLNRKGVIVFEDISHEDFDPMRYGKSLNDLKGNIHGVFPDGRVIGGIEVVRQAYGAIGLRWLVSSTSWPVLKHFFNFFYKLFAQHRLDLDRMIKRFFSNGK
ncbi:MAG: thiol-disulfide oxidoreductase DCC family protein [Candidatus Scalinduaceae bacterium]